MSKPITPAEVGSAKVVHIPAAVFDAFNAEIAKNFSHGSALVQQNAVVRRLTEGGMASREIFDAGWLNVESAYEDAGWKVTYDKPGFNEPGVAVFKFEAK